jgi:tripartite-type tricarboxylate transporter receptor subunit TctC
MRPIARRTLLLLASVLAPLSGVAAADYPTRSVELVVPFAAGGGTDMMARAFAEAAKRHLPQSIVVVNKPGASGAIGLGEVVNAEPDGYKMGLVTVELVILPLLNKARFAADDFRMIARLNADPAAITVRADSSWKTIDEFLADAKNRPGEVSLGNAGNGSIWQLAALALEDRTGAKFLHVPFQGAAPAVRDLLGGHVDAVAVSPAEVSAYVRSGEFRMLAVMADGRSPGFEDVPTLKERNIDLAIQTWRGLGVPKDTPQEVVDILVEAARKAADEPGFRDSLAKATLGFAYVDAAAFEAAIKQDREFFKQLIDKVGIQN